ncbi:unnamed protein product [Parnassius apollo]|uniref:(apollo) hypothetical protein n=1 Tax=Parnassius apollo TaxID=110799 RepID=A0A8S3WSC8_PARAO|nr:unnamed protein product [Parnassius apollo]
MKIERRVSDVTVKNCFTKAGFSIYPVNQDFQIEQNEVELDYELEVAPSNEEWAKLVSHDTTGTTGLTTT